MIYVKHYEQIFKKALSVLIIIIKSWRSPIN